MDTNLKTLEVYDPAMCCSTGVCGTSVDPALASFTGDLDWLGQRGVAVRRYNLGQEPGAFAARDDMRALLEEEGEAGLPAVYVDGELRSSGRFPSRDELASWVETDMPVVSAEVIAELAAIGAAVGSNCEPCFEFHYAEARKLGLTNDDLVLAVRTAQTVKAVPADNMLDTASRLLNVEVAAIGGTVPAGADTADESASSACCSGSAESIHLTKGAAPTSGCC
ncbi:MAG: arsenite efflux transporter metallochaperone ArsD [Acidimicrobiia bacterium]